MAIAKNLGIKNNNFSKSGNARFPVWFLHGELALKEQIKLLRSKQGETPHTKNLSIEKLKLKRIQQETMGLKSKKETLPTITTITNKNLLAKLKLKKSQIPDLPLLKFKVVTIGKYGYSLTEPALPWMIVGFGVVFGLFISIFMAFLIDLKNR